MAEEGARNSVRKGQPAAADDTAKPKPATGAAEPGLDIAGHWRDNLGITYDVEQTGHRFRYLAAGPSCQAGYNFSSSGSGTIDGLEVKSSYKADHEGNYSMKFQSNGVCSGALSADGTEMTSTCKDRVCGTITASLSKQ